MGESVVFRLRFMTHALTPDLKQASARWRLRSRPYPRSPTEWRSKAPAHFEGKRDAVLGADATGTSDALVLCQHPWDCFPRQRVWSSRLGRLVSSPSAEGRDRVGRVRRTNRCRPPSRCASSSP